MPNDRRPSGHVPTSLLLWGSLVPLAAIVAAFGMLALTYAYAAIPLPKDIKITASAEVFDRHGKLIGTYSNGENRFLINTKELPRYVSEAVISAEDRDFFNEGGVSLRGTLRAAWADVTGGGIQQGGSTLTQQYVKNAILNDPSRTFSRKIKEAVLAIKLDHRYSKQRILGFYLNTIYLGRGAYGVEAAARAYFGEHARQLTLPQAAFLAGIIPAPESYDPSSNPRLAKQRRNDVLQEMLSEGYITRSQADRAMRGKVHAIKDESISATSEKAAYFMEWLRKDYLYPRYHSCLYTCGLKIYTTLDLSMQHDAEGAIRSTLTSPGDPPAALVSLTPTGEVRALVGNSRHFTSVKSARGFNYATDPPGRQAGSSFKPFTLMAAIEQGVSPQSRFSGASPVTISDPECADPDGSPWQPHNYGEEQFGTITLDEATTNSVNTVYAQLIAHIGITPVVDLLKKFDFDRAGTPEQRPLPHACSIALGAVPDVTVMEQARAYAAVDNGGKLPPVRPIEYVKNRAGNCIVQWVKVAKQDCEKTIDPKFTTAVSPNTAALTTQVLTHVVQGGTATAANIGRPVAGKTGTTQDYRDAWFVGYVPQLTTAVWMGYPNHKGHAVYMRSCGDPKTCKVVHGYYSGVTGGSFPAMMWAKYMREALAGLPIEPFPTPTYMPLSVLNSAPPQPTFTPTGAPAPSPTKTPSSSPTQTPTARPTRTTEPSPTPRPTKTVPPPSPTVRPSPSNSRS